MQYTRFELFKKLLEHEIKYHNNKEHQGHLNQLSMEADGVGITIFEKTGTSAHCLVQFIKMAEAFRFCYFFSVHESKEGFIIPTLHIF